MWFSCLSSVRFDLQTWKQSNCFWFLPLQCWQMLPASKWISCLLELYGLIHWCLPKMVNVWVTMFIGNALCSRKFQNVNLIMLPLLRFYVKSNFSEFKWSKNVVFGNFRDSKLWIWVNLGLKNYSNLLKIKI